MQGLAVNKVFKLQCIVYIMSCDVRVRSGSRLKSTQAQSQLGREGKTPSCRRIIPYYRPSSPFSLSGRSHVEEPTNNETLKQDIIDNHDKSEQNGSSAPSPKLPMPAFCGGAAIKALYTNGRNGGRNTR